MGASIGAALRLQRINPFMLVAAFCVTLGAHATFGSEGTNANTIRQRMPAVDRFVAAEMRRLKVPGLAVGIVSGATVAAARGYGYANVELSVPVNQDTVFQSGSLGKPFTAMAVMLEVED